MDLVSADIAARGAEYALQRGLQLEARLGFGKDGTVWGSDQQSAIKSFIHRDPYQRELLVYQRLQRFGVVEIAGHRVPQLQAHDDATMVIEMSIVQPPFVLDFAGATLDRPQADFPEEVILEWLAQKREEFGSNWPRATLVLAGLRRHGIHMNDVHPGNIGFRPTSSTAD